MLCGSRLQPLKSPFVNFSSEECRDWSPHSLWIAQLPSQQRSTPYIFLDTISSSFADANNGIDDLYARAKTDYRQQSRLQTSAGVEAVVAMLDFAQRRGRYKVFVTFEGINQIPPGIEATLRIRKPEFRFAPILQSFAEQVNKAREARVVQRISSSFGKVIPGDILEFREGAGKPDDLSLVVEYVIQSSTDIYFPDKQKSLPMVSRDWYAGVSFDWAFHVLVPGSETTAYQFRFSSSPAELFSVAYTGTPAEGQEPAPTEVYDAMADSAFDGFSSKLLEALAVPQP
jgi:hypothetical protein